MYMCVRGRVSDDKPQWLLFGSEIKHKHKSFTKSLAVLCKNTTQYVDEPAHITLLELEIIKCFRMPLSDIADRSSACWNARRIGG